MIYSVLKSIVWYCVCHCEVLCVTVLQSVCHFVVLCDTVWYCVTVRYCVSLCDTGVSLCGTVCVCVCVCHCVLLCQGTQNAFYSLFTKSAARQADRLRAICKCRHLEF